MPAPLSGPGIGLQLPQNLYPSEVANAPYDVSSNRQALGPGQSLVLPAGDWYVSLGMYLVLQFLDPVSNTWSIGASGGWESGNIFVKSDGFNARIANLTGCPVGAVVTSYGGGWVQATTTITVTGGGGATYVPIVGGQLAFGSIVTGKGGAGYGLPPLVFIPPPPPAQSNPNGVGGVAASGYAGIASGTISGFTFTNPGAGYPVSTFNAVVVPSPFDPNLSTGITTGTITFSVVGSGSITAVLCTNNGSVLATPASYTLTVAGAGSNATVVPVVMQSVKTVSIVGSTGTSWGTTNAGVTSFGGYPSTGTITNDPYFNFLSFKPRPLQALVAVTGAGGTISAQTATIYDGGLFMNAPTAGIIPGSAPGQTGTGSIVLPSVVFTMGSYTDIAVIQPAP